MGPETYFYAQTKSDIESKVPEAIKKLEEKEKTSETTSDKETPKSEDKQKFEEKADEAEKKDSKPPSAVNLQLEEKDIFQDQFNMYSQLYGMNMNQGMMPMWGSFSPEQSMVNTDSSEPVYSGQLHWNQDPSSVPSPLEHKGGYLTST